MPAGEDAVCVNGYPGTGKREDATVRNKSGCKIKYKINRHPSRIKKLSKMKVERANHLVVFN